MTNPYSNLPDSAFWRRAVAAVPADDFDPMTGAPFTIGPTDKVATAGSCFAQHIARTLFDEGFGYLVTEPSPATPGAKDENYGVFPARFGNIYTVRQLLQLFQRAYGLFEPMDRFWTLPDGGLVDPFRPQIQAGGFSSLEALEADRRAHLAAVREMFETCDVFIFTLGLTEGWKRLDDGAVFPLAPGVAGTGSGEYGFENFSAPDMIADLTAFVTKLRTLNPAVRVILTVSPVPLVATYEPRHVLLSTIYSKSALRVAAEAVSQAFEGVAYFPSYEMIAGPQARGRYYAEDLREVTSAGVAHVMSSFRRHYLQADAVRKIGDNAAPPESSVGAGDIERFERAYQVICDEELLDG